MVCAASEGGAHSTRKLALVKCPNHDARHRELAIADASELDHLRTRATGRRFEGSGVRITRGIETDKAAGADTGSGIPTGSHRRILGNADAGVHTAGATQPGIAFLDMDQRSRARRNGDAAAAGGPAGNTARSLC